MKRPTLTERAASNLDELQRLARASQAAQAHEERLTKLPKRWVVVVNPRGDFVTLDERFNEFEDGASLTMMTLTGTLEDGQRVTVNGTHVALCWRKPFDRRGRM